MSDLRHVWGKEFQTLFRKSGSLDDLDDLVLCKMSPEAEIKASDDDDDVFEVVVSSNILDRDKDIIYQEGLDFTSYQKNPVVLFGHDSRTPAIARSEEIFQEGKRVVRTISRDRFVPDSAGHTLATTIKHLVQGKFLRAVSIGGMPQVVEAAEGEDRKFGLDILAMDVYEHSFVNIPANPEALLRAKAAGIDTDPLLEHAEETLKTALGEGFWLDRERAKAVVEVLGATKGLKVFEMSPQEIREFIPEVAETDDLPDLAGMKEVFRKSLESKFRDATLSRYGFLPGRD